MSNFQLNRYLMVLMLSVIMLDVNAQNGLRIINSQNLNKTLGSGVDVNEVEKENGRAFSFSVDTVKSGLIGSAEMYFVNDESAFREVFDVNAGIFARNLNYSVQASYGIGKSMYENTSRIKLVLKATEYYNQLQIDLASVRLTARANKAIAEGKFFEIFGTHFVTSVTTGSMVLIELDINTRSQSVKNSIIGSLKADVKSGLVRASAYGSLSQILEQNTSNISIGLNAKYYGLKSNAGIQNLIDNFKAGDGAGKFDFDKLLDGCKAQLVQMADRDAYQILLFIAPYFQIDSRLTGLKVDLTNDFLNTKLIRIVTEYRKTKNKLEQVEELLQMESNYYYKKFFYPNGTFDQKLYDRYLEYDRSLIAVLEQIQQNHKCLLLSKKNCPSQQVWNFDHIVIPPKYQPIYIWDANPAKKYIHNESIIQQPIKDLRPNADVVVKYNLVAKPETSCEPRGGAEFDMTLGCNGIIEHYHVNPVFDIAARESSFQSKTDGNGELNFFATAWLNWCAGITPYSFDASSYVIIEYKDK